MKRFSAVFTIFLAMALLLLCGATAFAAASPELDELEIIGDDGETYLDGDDFDPEETDYEIELGDDVSYLKVYLDYDNDYEVEVDYDGDGDVSELSSYWRVDIDDLDDLGDITVTVYGEDDDETEYIIAVSADGSGSGSGADELTDLYLNAGSAYSNDEDDELALHPEFDEDNLDYAVLVPYTEQYSELNLRIYLEDGDVEAAVEGAAVSVVHDSEEDAYYYDYGFPLPDEGDSSTIEFTVEDVDYTLTVYFAEEDGDDEAYLEELAVRTRKSTSSAYELALDPEFDENEDEYSLAVDTDEYETLYLYAEADNGMVILVEDQPLHSYWAFDPGDYDEITITVYAPNLEDDEEYTINLEEGPSSLSSLYLYTGGYGSVVLSPAFSAARHNYTAQVSAGENSVSIIPSGSSAVKIAQNGGSYQTYTTNTAYTLSDGLNVFDIQVGASTHYYVNLYRQPYFSSIVASSQYISVNGGAARQIAAYNINGNNFVKLRDIAYLLSGTAKQFSVGYNDASQMITLYSGGGYLSVGGEMGLPGFYNSAAVTTQSIYLDGSLVAPMAYNIDGNNYFLLRDLAALFDFGVSFSGSTVYVNTGNRYSYSS